MSKRKEFVLAGSSGQGLVMMGILLGQAANQDGYTVAQSQSYGIAARGGVSFSEVVISDDVIVYPKTSNPDLILALTQETYEMFHKKYPDCLIVVDSDAVSVPEDEKNARSLPLTGYCRKVGNMRVLNLLGIGVVQGFTNAISNKAMEDTIQERFPKECEANLAAFHKGIEFAVATKEQ